MTSTDMTLQIFGYEQNPRTRLVRIVAELEHIPYELKQIVPRKNINKAQYTKDFPLSHGKIPGIKIGDFRLTETIAIVTYLSKLSSRSGLLGDGSLQQEAKVISWMSWANQELLQTLALWFLPLIPGFSDPPPYSSSAVEDGRMKSARLLNTLEATLEEQEWLVGDHITLADIMVAIYVSRGLEWVLDTRWRSHHPNTMRHFFSVTNLPEVKKVVPEFVLIEHETPNKNPYT